MRAERPTLSVGIGLSEGNRPGSPGWRNGETLSTGPSISIGSETSCSTNRKLGSIVVRGDVAASAPVNRLSTQMTSPPSAEEAIAGCEPMNPAPPGRTVRTARPPEPTLPASGRHDGLVNIQCVEYNPCSYGQFSGCGRAGAASKSESGQAGAAALAPTPSQSARPLAKAAPLSGGFRFVGRGPLPGSLCAGSHAESMAEQLKLGLESAAPLAS